MLLLAGTVPSNVGEIIAGRADFGEKGIIRINAMNLPLTRGTASLVGAAAAACRYFNLDPPYVIMAGDIGQKTSGANIYEGIQAFVQKNRVKTLVLHYLMPNIQYHKRLMAVIQRLDPIPCLIADAGSMYVAKAAGQASLYDLFTPDLGELAFLADDKASHPAYTRGFICHLEGEAAALIERAYKYNNSAKYLCVKGCTDYVCCNGSIVEKVDDPSVEVLEAIGGTGDTITGIAAALIYKGMNIVEACSFASKANRWAGKLANPNPATQISEIIKYLPEAIEKTKNAWADIK
ncbi:sugar kinase [bacterium]|nr:sugar kinase [bacterium]